MSLSLPIYLYLAICFCYSFCIYLSKCLFLFVSILLPLPVSVSQSSYLSLTHRLSTFVLIYMLLTHYLSLRLFFYIYLSDCLSVSPTLLLYLSVWLSISICVSGPASDCICLPTCLLAFYTSLVSTSLLAVCVFFYLSFIFLITYQIKYKTHLTYSSRRIVKINFFQNNKDSAILCWKDSILNLCAHTLLTCVYLIRYFLELLQFCNMENTWQQFEVNKKNAWRVCW